jgi:hypothetical protein
MRIWTKWVGASSLLIATAVAGQASAICIYHYEPVRTFYPAHQCRLVTFEQEGNSGSTPAFIHEAGHILSALPSDDEHDTFVCPIDWRYWNNGEMEDAKVAVYMLDQNDQDGNDVNCWMVAMDANDLLTSQSTVKSTSGHSTSATPVYAAWLQYNFAALYEDWGFLKCEVPGIYNGSDHSGIAGYWVDEADYWVDCGQG